MLIAVLVAWWLLLGWIGSSSFIRRLRREYSILYEVTPWWPEEKVRANKRVDALIIVLFTLFGPMTLLASKFAEGKFLPGD